MGDVLLGFVQANSSVDYSFVIPFILGYIALFWVIVSIWVYYDAKKRFGQKRTSILISIGNFIFQLPFLLLYLLFRPIEEEYLESGSQGGVSVPIVNFIGKEGVVMSLEIKINQQKLSPENASEMKVDVSFSSDDSNKQLLEQVKPILEESKVVVERGLLKWLKKVNNIFVKKIKTEDKTQIGVTQEKDTTKKKKKKKKK